MNTTAFFYFSGELVKQVAENIAKDEHPIILINDLGVLEIYKDYQGVDEIKEALETRLIAKKEELYETLSSFLPTLSSEARELNLKNLQGVFEKINESRFFALAK